MVSTDVAAMRAVHPYALSPLMQTSKISALIPRLLLASRSNSGANRRANRT